MKRNLHVAFFSLSLYGHVNPTLPIVSSFVRRGYRVSYVTSDRFSSRIRALGADFISCGDPLDNVAFCSFATSTLAEVTPFFENNRPDLVIYDWLTFSGRILANRWNIPAVQTSPEFAFDKNQFDHQVQHSEFRKFILEMAEPFDTFLERYGIASNGGLFHRERLNVYFFAETFQPCKDTCDDSCFYASRCPAEQPYVGDWSVQNSGGRPVALVSASTCFIRGPDYYKMCIEALAGQQWHVVLCIGDHVDPSTLKPLPPHFEVVQGISQNRILPHASLFIFSGGMISTTEAAYHGVPLIAVTNGGLELEWLADSTLVRHAIGLHLRKSETNVESLRQAAIQVAADVKIRDRIKRLQRAIKQAPGGEETANRIEYYLETQNS